MSSYTVYDPATGEIQYSLTGAVDETNIPAGLAMAEGVFSSKKYYFDISQQTFAERPVLDLQYSADPVTVDTYFRVDNIPAGATVDYPGGSMVVDDGFIEWTTDIPGDYTFTLSAPNYLPVTITVIFID